MIQLYPANSGGQPELLSDGVWQVVLAANGGKTSARLTFAGEPGPGEEFIANVELLVSGACEFFQIGTKFVVWENGTKGIGVVDALTPWGAP